MKTTIKFSKAYVPTVALSVAIILSGLVGLLIFHGFRMGVDFASGINETVQFAIPAMKVTYSGEGNATLKVGAASATLVVSGTKSDDKTVDLPFSAQKSIGGLAAALSAIKGVTATATAEGSAELDCSAIIPSQQGSNLLGANDYLVHRKILKPSERFAETSQVRKALESLGEVGVQVAGDKAQQIYAIRIQDPGTQADFARLIPAKIEASFSSAFGADKVIVLSTDIVGAAFSKDLGWQAILLTFGALIAILLYCMVRFKLQFAIGAVLSVVHDALIMIAFVAWTRMEFNASTIAAILTILGYSINDTIVIFDRIRENLKLPLGMKYSALMDYSNTEMLGRTIITSMTTLLCVVTLYIFTNGQMKDFALLLIVGIVSGTYSSIYIATSFSVLWDTISEKRKSRRQAKEHGEIAPAKA